MMGIADEIEAIKIDEMTEGASGLVSAGWSDLERMIEAATDTERRIIEQRLLRTPPRTLEDVGSEAGVTRERIRQIQVRVEKKIRSALGAGLPVIAPMLKEELGHLISRGELETRIETLLPKQQGVAKKLFERALIDGMGLTLDHGMYLDERARRELEQIRSATRRLADDVGLVDADRVAGEFPGPGMAEVVALGAGEMRTLGLVRFAEHPGHRKGTREGRAHVDRTPGDSRGDRRRVRIRNEQSRLPPLGDSKRHQGGQGPLGAQGVGRRRVRRDCR